MGRKGRLDLASYSVLPLGWFYLTIVRGWGGGSWKGGGGLHLTSLYWSLWIMKDKQAEMEENPVPSLPTR